MIPLFMQAPIFEDGIWNGYCPESWLKGKTVKMRLNDDDFYESEETGLQIVISIPGFIATILKFRGKGLFRKSNTYAHEDDRNEILAEQTLEVFPYSEDDLIQTSEELHNYLKLIK
jgi:hypothetical protein